MEVRLEFRLEGNTGRERSRHRCRQQRVPRKSLLRREAGPRTTVCHRRTGYPELPAPSS